MNYRGSNCICNATTLPVALKTDMQLGNNMMLWAILIAGLLSATDVETLMQ